MAHDVFHPTRSLARSAKAAIVALAVLVGGGAVAETPPALQVGDIVAGPNSTGTGFRFITEKGSVAFSVPGDWPNLAMQSRPPVSVAGFQVPNSADQGTPDSTNVAISVFHLDTQQAQSARGAVGKQFGPTPPVISRSNAWTIYRQEAMQGATTYTLLDGVRDFPDINVAVTVRLAWPHLTGNPAGYDASMEALYTSLLGSVSSAPGAYAPGPREVVRRPTP